MVVAGHEHSTKIASLLKEVEGYRSVYSQEPSETLDSFYDKVCDQQINTVFEQTETIFHPDQLYKKEHFTWLQESSVRIGKEIAGKYAFTYPLDLAYFCKQ